MVKRITSLICAAALCLTCPVAFAASSEQQDAAENLFMLGLFKGSGELPNGSVDFDLDRAPTRNEAVTMLIRLLGEEAEAQSKEWDMPFVDVAEWAKPYVGYAYNNGLTTGTSSTTFSGQSQVTANQYATFVLRSLGYSDKKDFKYNDALSFFEQIDDKSISYDSSGLFTRGDVALMSYNALSCNTVNNSGTLILALVNAGVVEDWQIMDNADLLEAANAITLPTPSNLRINSLNGTPALVWDEVNPECIYEVSYKGDTDAEYMLLGIVPTPYMTFDSNYLVGEIIPGTFYSFKVRAIVDHTDTGENLRRYSYYSGSIGYTVMNEISPTNDASITVISSVLNLVAESAQKQQDALILCQSALVASTPSQGLYFAKLAQDDFIESQTALYDAFQQCKNYDNLQDCVVPMATVHSLLAPTTGTTVTQSNYLDYVINSISFSSMATDYFDEFTDILINLHG